MMATTEASEDEEEVVSIGAQSTITSIGSWVGLRLDRGQRRERLVGHGFISTWSHEIPENKGKLVTHSTRVFYSCYLPSVISVFGRTLCSRKPLKEW